MTRVSLKAVLVGATLAVFASVQVMEEADARGRRGGGFSRGGPASAGGFSGRGGGFGQRGAGRVSMGSRSGGRGSLGEAAEDRREYRQDAMDDRREFRQDVAEDHWDDYHDRDSDAGAFIADQVFDRLNKSVGTVPEPAPTFDVVEDLAAILNVDPSDLRHQIDTPRQTNPPTSTALATPTKTPTTAPLAKYLGITPTEFAANENTYFFALTVF